MGGTSQNEVMGVAISEDHALRDAQGRATQFLKHAMTCWSCRRNC